MTTRRFALLSVSDKTGLAEFGKGLVEAGFTLLSTGGTARALAAAGVPVTKVSDHTGFPEIMQGRVKTLHPKIHGGILGRRDAHAAEATAHGIGWIDVVAVNLYPFVKTIQRDGVTTEEAVEQIDIGGPTMVRAAAKNHQDVCVVVSPDDYDAVLAELRADGAVAPATRRRLAARAFGHTAAYDGAIATWMAGLDTDEQGRPALPGAESGLPLQLQAPLRYGENPHQRATFFAEPVASGRSLARLTQLKGRQLSFNNLADLDAALRAVFEFEEPACVVVKHANPCGAAVHTGGLADAFKLALSADPVSAFGGIVVWNKPVDKDAIVALRKARLKVEIIAAPGFTEAAREAFPPKKDVRILELPADWAQSRPSGFDAKRVQGGWLLQDWDLDAEIGWTVASTRAPTPDEREALGFAWRVCRSVKSNAIVLAQPADGGFVANGVGAGQMSRVDSTRIALSKATRPVPGSVLASDAFFPFPDAVEIALEAGVTAFVQPGGAMRDEAVLEAINAAGATMVFTGKRHFRH